MRNSGMYMYYGFGFLTLEQNYICKNENLTESCSAEKICQMLNNHQVVNFEIDKTHSNYLSNWI
jgi:hypothetical protein